MKKLFLLLMLLPGFAVAQQVKAPRDTSFTVYSTYIKVREQYPFVEVVRPEMPKGILASENVVYRTLGNRQLHMDIFYPAQKNQKKYPGVLLIHGGGWRSGDKSHQVPVAQQLAAKGYVTAAVEYRLSTEALYPAAVYDLKAAIRWLRANASLYSIDTTKIAALGCSSGGQLAALLGTTNGEKKFEGSGENPEHSSSVQAIIDIDGILAFDHPESEEYGNDPNKTSAATYWFGGRFEEKPALWHEASPLLHVDQHTAPILFINSSLPRFHAGRDDMIEQLDSLGIYSEVHTLPDTPHPFWLFHPWFEPTFEWVHNFLEKVLKSINNEQ